MLNNPFRYLRRKWTMQSHGRRTALYSVQPACACASIPTDWYLQVEEPPTSPCRGVVHRTKRKGYAMHAGLLLSSSTSISCVSFLKYMCTSNQGGDRMRSTF